MKKVKHDWKKSKTIYYSDPLRDDFNEVGLDRPSLPKDYVYERNNKVVNFFTGLFYFVIVKPILWIFCKSHSIKIKGKKNLKELKGKGFFIYANHVAISDSFKIQALLFPFKRTNAVGYTDAMSVPVLGGLMKGLGLIPLPLKGDYENMKKFINSFSFYLAKKQAIIIFPEAHIWPYYTKIRPFRNGSFYYPALNNCPVVPMVTVWRKSKISKKSKQTLLIGKPIYPIEGHSVLENKEYLHKATYEAMVNLSNSVKQYEYITYIYKEKE